MAPRTTWCAAPDAGLAVVTCGKAGERPGEDEEGDADNVAHLVCLVL